MLKGVIVLSSRPGPPGRPGRLWRAQSARPAVRHGSGRHQIRSTFYPLPRFISSWLGRVYQHTDRFQSVCFRKRHADNLFCVKLCHTGQWALRPLVNIHILVLVSVHWHKFGSVHYSEAIDNRTLSPTATFYFVSLPWWRAVNIFTFKVAIYHIVGGTGQTYTNVTWSPIRTEYPDMYRWKSLPCLPIEASTS